MATVAPTISNFYINSSWKGYEDTDGTNVYYTTASTGYADYQYSLGSVPAGAIIDSAIVTSTLGAPYTGIDNCYINYDGVDYNFKPGSLDITAKVIASQASGAVVFRYRFKANGGQGSTSVGGTSHSASLSFNNNVLTITYHMPMSSFSLSTSSLEAGQSITVTITPADSSYRHTIDFAFGSATQQFTGVVSSQAFTIPLTGAGSWLYQIPNSTSGTAVCTVSTYNAGGTFLGASVAQYFTVNAPASIVPTLTSITPALVDGYWGLYVQGKSRVTLTANGAAGAYGSTITAYSVAGSGSNPYTTGVLYTAGTNTFYASVTDSRGRTSTVVSCNISVTAYAPPVITGVLSQRASNINGALSDDGTYVKCTIYYTWSAIGSNSVDSGVDYKATTSGTWVSGSTTDKASGSYWVLYAPFSTDVSYDIRVYIKDYFSTYIYAYSGIQTAKCIMDIRAGGNGIAFGKVAEADNILEIAPGWMFKSSNIYGLKISPVSGEASMIFGNGSTDKWIIGKGTSGIGDEFGWYSVENGINAMVLFRSGVLSVGNVIYEAGTQLAGKYLGINAKAADANLFDGLDNNSFVAFRGWEGYPGPDANWTDNGVTFTYANQAPSVGALVTFNPNGYGLQFSGAYNSAVGELSFRNRNGDSAYWQPWRQIYHTGNFTRGTGTPSGGGDQSKYVQYI